MGGEEAVWFYLKSCHILFAMLYLGTGLGSAYYKLRAFRSGDPRVIAFCDREIVRADWIFTVPSGIVMPATGAAMVKLLHLPWTTSWVVTAFSLWILAGAAWLWAAVLQIKMRNLATHAVERNEPLPKEYVQAQRLWMLLGIPAFLAAMATVIVMVTKPILW